MTIKEDTIFGEWLLDEMEAHEMSIQQLADLSDVTEPGIRSILYTDRKPRIDTMYKLATALGKKIQIVDRDEGVLS